MKDHQLSFLLMVTQSSPNPPGKKSWVSESPPENPATAQKNQCTMKIHEGSHGMSTCPSFWSYGWEPNTQRENIWRHQNLIQAAKSRDVGTLKRDTRQMSKPRRWEYWQKKYKDWNLRQIL